MSKLRFAAFHANEVTITEYCLGMKHVVKALDVLQAERSCYLGTVTPTLVSLRTKLSLIKHDVKVVSSLLNAVLDGPSFEADNLIIAAVTLP